MAIGDLMQLAVVPRALADIPPRGRCVRCCPPPAHRSGRIPRDPGRDPRRAPQRLFRA